MMMERLRQTGPLLTSFLASDFFVAQPATSKHTTSVCNFATTQDIASTVRNLVYLILALLPLACVWVLCSTI